jgi:hypothetical protein
MGQDAFPPELVRWRLEPGTPVFSGRGAPHWDARIRERGWIFREGGVYHLFYTGYNDDAVRTRRLGHATSHDGKTWTRDAANPLSGTGEWVEDMCVVRHEGLYHMFAEGAGDIAHHLTSPDLVRWTERGALDIRRADGTPIEPGPRGTPFVLIRDGVWNLFYERGDQGVWLARSGDGAVFTNVQDDPVLALGPGAYDQHAVALNQVFERDGVFYALYHANATRPWGDWTTCLARSRDLIHWEKYAGNPIIAGNRSSAILVSGPEGEPLLFTMHPEVQRFVPAP